MFHAFRLARFSRATLLALLAVHVFKKPGNTLTHLRLTS
jgi:hypothetical protein